jgi:hypothetical protein
MGACFREGAGIRVSGPVASTSVVAATIQARGATRLPNLDSQYSFAFSVRNPITGKEHLFFIPGSSTGEYTLGQLDIIEQTLAYFGVELLPLDYSAS